jgi:hypothetical protein
MISRHVSRVVVWVAAGAVLLAMSGCAASVPATKSTPSHATAAVPTPTAAPVAAAVMVRGTSLDVMSEDGRIIQSIPYSGGDKSLVSALTAVLGAPVSKTYPDNGCAGGTGTGHQPTASNWGGETLVVTSFNTGPTDFVVSLSGSSVNGIELETAGGFHVGDSSKDLAKQVPGVVSQDSTIWNNSYLWYDLAADSTPAGKSGVVVYADSVLGPITTITGPEQYWVNDGSGSGGDC